MIKYVALSNSYIKIFINQKFQLKKRVPTIIYHKKLNEPSIGAAACVTCDLLTATSRTTGARFGSGSFRDRSKLTDSVVDLDDTEIYR